MLLAFFATGGRMPLSGASFFVAWALVQQIGRHIEVDEIRMVLVFGFEYAALAALSLFLRNLARPRPISANSDLIHFVHYSSVDRGPSIQASMLLEPRSRGLGVYPGPVVYGWGTPVCKWANAIFGVRHEIVVYGVVDRKSTEQLGLGFLVATDTVRVNRVEFA